MNFFNITVIVTIIYCLPHITLNTKGRMTYTFSHVQKSTSSDWQIFVENLITNWKYYNGNVTYKNSTLNNNYTLPWKLVKMMVFATIY